MESKGLVAELQRAAICPACRGHFKDPVILDCDHSYCRACITRYWDEEAIKGNSPRVVSCPQCKKVFERRNLRTNVKLAVEVKITQHLNAKTAQVPLAPKSKRRRGGWRPTTSIPKEKLDCSQTLPVVRNAQHLECQISKLTHVGLGQSFVPGMVQDRKASENSAAVMVTWQKHPARRLMAGKKQGQNSECNRERTNKAALKQEKVQTRLQWLVQQTRTNTS
ncbi:RING finger protein 39, partial [Ophiophagus hannah]